MIVVRGGGLLRSLQGQESTTAYRWDLLQAMQNARCTHKGAPHSRGWRLEGAENAIARRGAAVLPSL